MVVTGQALRTLAMHQAGSAFTHEVACVKRQGHRLIRHGVYRYHAGGQSARSQPSHLSSHMRHPSYAGFYLWALGTQAILGNPICFLAYAAVLYRFFAERIRAEEALLIEFFPVDYPPYQRATWAGIPGLGI